MCTKKVKNHYCWYCCSRRSQFFEPSSSYCFEFIKTIYIPRMNRTGITSQLPITDTDVLISFQALTKTDAVNTNNTPNATGNGTAMSTTIGAGTATTSAGTGITGTTTISNSSNSPPPVTPISKPINAAGSIIKKEKRQSSSLFNITKNRELTSLRPLDGKWPRVAKHRWQAYLLQCLSSGMNLLIENFCNRHYPIHNDRIWRNMPADELILYAIASKLFPSIVRPINSRNNNAVYIK